MSQYFGVDLAWGEGSARKAANETGLALVDESGRVLNAGWAIGIEAVADWLTATARPGAIIAIDAPLVIPNVTGMRLAEKQVASAYGRWMVAANASNLTMGWKGGLALRDRLEGAGFVYSDGLGEADPAHITFFECYPYTTLVGTEFFAYNERPRYKRFDKSLAVAAAREKRAIACDDLLIRMSGLANTVPPLDMRSHPLTRQLLDEASPIADVPYKHREDLIDALLSAWTAQLWVSSRDLVQVLGADDPDRDEQGRLATIVAPARGWQRLADRAVQQVVAPRASSAPVLMAAAVTALRATSGLSEGELDSVRTDLDRIRAELDRLSSA